MWAAEPRVDEVGVAPSHAMGRIRFFERGTGRLWLAPADRRVAARRQRAQRARRAPRAGRVVHRRSRAATGLGSARALRDALRELVAGGLVTNDTVEALRDVLRWRPRFPVKRPDEPDPDALAAGGLHAVGQPADRAAPRQPAPAREVEAPRPRGASPRGADAGRSCTRSARSAPSADEQALAERVARQWLARYGIVSRDWWRRERPAVGWREIYHELKRLEFRGEVQRGYFVAGLAGAQFALPEAVEMLRAPVPDDADDDRGHVGRPIRRTSTRCRSRRTSPPIRSRVRAAPARCS